MKTAITVILFYGVVVTTFFLAKRLAGGLHQRLLDWIYRPAMSTFVWVSGLVTVFALGAVLVGSLGWAIYRVPTAHTNDELAELFVLPVVTGLTSVWFVNRFYEWHSHQRVHFLLGKIQALGAETQEQAQFDRLAADFSSEFSDTFKQQLLSSPTFQSTVIEAMSLVREVTTFASASHTSEEWDAFRRTWQAKSEQFAERIAAGDPLAVQVILKAIEQESEK